MQLWSKITSSCLFQLSSNWHFSNPSQFLNKFVWKKFDRFVEWQLIIYWGFFSGQSRLFGSLSHWEQHLRHSTLFNFGPEIQGSKAAFWAWRWGYEVKVHSFDWRRLLASSWKISWRHQKQASLNVQFWQLCSRRKSSRRYDPLFAS